MVVIGAKGFAKEILEILFRNGIDEELYFYDDITADKKQLLFGKYKILNSESEIKQVFENVGPSFVLGVGNPKLRYSLYKKFCALGGELISTISDNAVIGNFDVKIGSGSNILSGVQISNDVVIGMGVILYYNSIITHDVKIGDFAEISPGAILLGRCSIGRFTHVGAGAVIFPDVKIGENVTIGAGAVLRNNVPSDCIAVGIPAKVIKLK